MSNHNDREVFEKDITVKQRVVLKDITAPSGNPPDNHGWLYLKDDGGTSALYFEDDAGTVTKIGASTVNWEAIGDAGSAGTIDWAAFKQIITTALNAAGANLTMTNTTADLTADVCFIDFKYTDDGDVNGFYLRGYDNAGNDLKWSIGADGAFVMGALTATTGAFTGAVTAASLAATGKISATGGLSSGNSADSTIMIDTLTLTAQQVKALRATPIALVVAPGVGKVIAFMGATFILNYGSEVFATPYDLQIQYDTASSAVSGKLTGAGFIDQAGDRIGSVIPAAVAGIAAASIVNKALYLKNTDGGEISGNASNDSTLTVKVSYRIHTTGL